MSNQQQQNQSAPKTDVVTTALVPVETSTNINALVPTTIDGAMQFARWLAQSSLLPKSITREHDIFFIITAGMEIGIPPMAALRSLYCVNGRTALESRAKMALCLSKGAAKYFRRVEYTPEATTWETLRHGQTEPVQMRYTRKEAIAAFLAPGPNPDGKGPPVAGKEGPWRLYTQRMISHRALGWLCDDVYPDIVLGVATAEDFDQSEFTFRPITPGIELSASPPQHLAPVGPPPGVPTTAKLANEEPPAAKPASEASPLEQKKAPSPPPKTPLENEDEIQSIIDTISRTDKLPDARRVSQDLLANREMTDAVRARIVTAYENHCDLIRDASKKAKE